MHGACAAGIRQSERDGRRRGGARERDAECGNASALPHEHELILLDTGHWGHWRGLEASTGAPLQAARAGAPRCANTGSVAGSRARRGVAGSRLSGYLSGHRGMSAGGRGRARSRRHAWPGAGLVATRSPSADATAWAAIDAASAPARPSEPEAEPSARECTRALTQIRRTLTPLLRLQADAGCKLSFASGRP